jgi:hypothetical protein
MGPAPPCGRQGYGCGATITKSEVVHKITNAMQSSGTVGRAVGAGPSLEVNLAR